jgi:peptidoglycan/xylan/chitin deacetylase (PgdA/CDA1 family)
MKLPGTSPLKAVARQTANRLSPPPLILLYHRVTDLQTDPQQLAVSPIHFSEQLNWLQSHAAIISLSDLLKWLPTGRWPRRAVVITFDDGYADNFLQALPLLKKQNAPENFYLTGDCIDRQEEFFWDELDRLLLQPGWAPPVLKLEVDQRVYQWDLRPYEHYSPADARTNRRWNVLQPGPTVRHTVYRTLCDFVRKLPPAAQQSVMTRIRDWAGAERIARPTHRMLSKDEAIELAATPAVEIGAHTMHHPVLSQLSPAEQRQEIRRSKAALEAHLHRPIHAFSYPYGSSDSFSPQTIAAVKESAFTSAATTLPAAVQKRGDPFQLPRQIIRDWDIQTFQQHIRDWFVNG